MRLRGNIRVKLEDQLAGGVAELPERLAGGGTGKAGVGLGHVGVGQVAGFLFDDPQVDWVDLAGGQRGEGRREPLGDLGGEVHLPGGALLAHVQLAGQFVGGELAVQARAGAAGELRDRGHHGPGIAGFLPAGGGDDPHQLVIRAAR